MASGRRASLRVYARRTRGASITAVDGLNNPREVERIDRRTLNRFTTDISKRFDHRDLEPLKWAIIRRRRVLAMQLRP